MGEVITAVKRTIVGWKGCVIEIVHNLGLASPAIQLVLQTTGASHYELKVTRAKH